VSISQISAADPTREAVVLPWCGILPIENEEAE
jgi:hypothetical protein